MPTEPEPYVGALLVAAIIALAVAGFAWRRAPVAGARVFALFVFAVAVWQLAYALELASGTPEVRLIWAQIGFLGIVALHPLWFIFALTYTGRARWLAGRRWALLFVLPLISLALIWTNDQHGLFWRTAGLEPAAAVPQLRLTRGPWYWVHTGYSYWLYLLGLALLLGHLLGQPAVYRRQALALAVGSLIPFLANLLHLYGLFPLPALDPTPFAAALGVLVFAWALFRHRLLDIVPLGYRAVVRSISDGVIMLDVQGYVVDLNPSAERIVGRSAGRAVGQPLELVLSGRPDLLPAGSAASGLPDEVSLEVGGEIRHYDLTISPLEDPSGRPRGQVALLHDVTDRRQAARDRASLQREQAAGEAAREAARQRAEYLSVAAHELRTPITALRGFAQILLRQLELDGRIDPQLMKRALQTIDQQSEHLARLIDQLLDASRLEAGRLVLEPTLTNTSQLVERVVGIVRTTTDRHTFELAIEPNVRAILDGLRVEQVLTNLLDNAVKYSPEGGPIVVELAQTDPTCLRIAVTDRGVGIPPEARERIFDRFYQAPQAGSGGKAGLGLGLYISRQIVEQHGGRLWAESPSDGGTRFVLSLPTALEPTASD